MLPEDGAHGFETNNVDLRARVCPGPSVAIASARSASGAILLIPTSDICENAPQVILLAGLSHTKKAHQVIGVDFACTVTAARNSCRRPAISLCPKRPTYST